MKSISPETYFENNNADDHVADWQEAATNEDRGSIVDEVVDDAAENDLLLDPQEVEDYLDMF